MDVKVYDMRFIQDLGNKAAALLSTMHKGADANGCSVVCYGLSRSFITGGMNAGGIPISKELQPAMQANGAAAVCYQIGGPRNAFCETDISRTLDTSCLQPACNEGGMAIVHIIDHSRRHNYQQLDTVPTLEAHMGTGGGNVPLVLMEESNESIPSDHGSIVCE